MDVRQKIVDEFLKKLAESPNVGHPLLEELARLVSEASVTQQELLDLFESAVDHEN